jgi:hypothetical protein
MKQLTPAELNKIHEEQNQVEQRVGPEPGGNRRRKSVRFQLNHRWARARKLNRGGGGKGFKQKTQACSAALTAPEHEKPASFCA